MQVIEEGSGWRMEEIDLRGKGEQEREEEVQRLRQEEIERKFDLEKGGLFRVRLVRLEQEEQVLLITMHHIISDGWSMGVLMRELGELYAGEVEGREVKLEELGVQYGDYAEWEREWMKGEMQEKQLEYWREVLGDAPGGLELPTDRVRPVVPSFRGGLVGLEVGEEGMRGLEKVRKEEGATLYMVLLGCVQVVLGRWSGQRDIVVGTPIAGRKQRETEGLIGFFVNMLAMRVKLGEEASFREVVREVKKAALGAYAHQEMPFAKLVAELQPERHLSRRPFLQVAFALENIPYTKLECQAKFAAYGR